MWNYRLSAWLLGALVATSAAACGDDGDDDASPDANGGDTADAGANSADGSPAADAAPDGADSGGAITDPGAAGDYDVHVADGVEIEVGTGTATATICSPSIDGGATAASGPFPLVIGSPGFQLPRTQYASACRHLASWGFVVIAQDFASGSILDAPQHEDLANDVGDLIDWALGADSGLAPRLDANAIATVGHSLGGKISILAAILDDRVDAVVGWDPVDSKPPVDNGSPSVTPELMAGLTVPLLVLGETLDATGTFSACAPTEDNYTQFFTHACAAPVAVEITVDDADHMDWVDDRASCGFTCSVCKTGSADDAHTRELTRRATTAFLLKHLLGRDGFDAYLTPPELGTGATVRTEPPCG